MLLGIRDLTIFRDRVDVGGEAMKSGHFFFRVVGFAFRVLA